MLIKAGVRAAPSFSTEQAESGWSMEVQNDISTTASLFVQGPTRTLADGTTIGERLVEPDIGQN
jgi:hypothetical protein